MCMKQRITKPIASCNGSRLDISVDRKSREHCVWVCESFSRRATVDTFERGLIKAIEEFKKKRYETN